MSKSILYTANTNDQTVAVNGIINFGTPVRRYGNNLDSVGGNVIETGAGYYKHTVDLDVQGSAAGDVIITFYKNGQPITGAQITLTTATGDNYSVSKSFVTRETCCKEGAITAILTGIPATFILASVVSEKL